ncbi:hypothetical protein [Rheinheimera hassiensis]|uniref:hypothetical protein n=1 Tax=Rheinheimera hassiensis TaxID=1193627 RepID=UPI001F05A561|nr:hypothetical protein [Rheinheimera hassiensis]
MQTQKKRLVIKAGQVVSFDGDISFDGLQVHSQSKKRVSRIVPTHWAISLAFYSIRATCRDNSKLAAWTRLWRCEWTVIIDGSKYPGFTCRSAAIEFEKDKIWRQNKLKLELDFEG